MRKLSVDLVAGRAGGAARRLLHACDPFAPVERERIGKLERSSALRILLIDNYDSYVK